MVVPARPVSGGAVAADWGDLLHDFAVELDIQFGKATMNFPNSAVGTLINVPFPRPFASRPSVVATMHTNTDVGYSGAGILPDRCELQAREVREVALNGSQDVYWMAVGPRAPVVPVDPNAGSPIASDWGGLAHDIVVAQDIQFGTFDHDFNGAVGNTDTIVFPRPYAANPVVVAALGVNTNVGVTALNVSSVNLQGREVRESSSGPVPGYWIASGPRSGVVPARPIAGAPVASDWGGMAHDAAVAMDIQFGFVEMPFTAAVGNATPVTFPRPFAAPPVVVDMSTVNVNVGIEGLPTATGCVVRGREVRESSVTGTRTVFWIAIGPRA